ncbi:MAG: acetyltransferase [Acidobacteria bacterium]|nr:acetyltransferase [Acidobacteriota bacterium]MBI3281302.1 acetyltransferase [Acidobacteriota bacterium]
MIEVRELTDHADLAEAVRLQQVIWGFEEIELLPIRLFVVASKIGGQALGAFEGAKMIGFSLAIPGLKAGGRSYWHSHMMGVLEEYRNRGAGRMLKLRQRLEALERGIELVEWTFDPLELKNAFFNLERLGAIVRRYVLNQYGTTSSHLHGGLPTDRCIAEWWVGSPRVELTVNSEGAPRAEIRARIGVPNDIAAIRVADPRKAREIQRRVGDAFAECLERGLAVVGFERGTEEGTYLLAQWPSA